MTIAEILAQAPVIPVLELEGFIDPAQLAAVLARNGLRVIEVTLRTPQALDAIRAMSTVPHVIVGAGTVLDPDQLDRAAESGARFIVSPGLTGRLASAARERRIPFLPGVATAGDIMRGLDEGLNSFKFFPAEASGGLKALHALSGPFGGANFCPTGGITAQTAPDWLSHPAVRCVGGSWIVPKGESDLDRVRQRAAAAAQLRRQ